MSTQTLYKEMNLLPFNARYQYFTTMIFLKYISLITNNHFENKVYDIQSNQTFKW